MGKGAKWHIPCSVSGDSLCPTNGYYLNEQGIYREHIKDKNDTQ